MTIATGVAPHVAHRPLLLPDGTVAQLDGPLDAGIPVVILLHGFAGDSISMTRSTPEQRSLRDVLLRAGFSTLSYRQIAPLGILEPNVAQLLDVAAGPLRGHRLRRLPLVLLAHSRGGLLARSFIARAADRPELAGVVDRIEQVITLHSPHQGSGLAGLTVRMDATARRLQLLVRALGLRPSALASLCALAASPAVAELAPGSPLLRSLDRGSPPAGVAWHTFGGISADLAGIARLRGMGELLGAVNRLARLSPALRDGEGDLVVADACARLPYASSHTVNRLTHLESLSSAALHDQVVDLLVGSTALAAA